jgi:Domain of unknown function (DUF4148)
MKMNAKKLIASVALFAATGATFAAEISQYVDFSDFQSTKTRAEVRAERDEAIRDGELARSGNSGDSFKVVSTKSRDEVRAEAVKAAHANDMDLAYIGG